MRVLVEGGVGAVGAAVRALAVVHVVLAAAVAARHAHQHQHQQQEGQRHHHADEPARRGRRLLARADARVWYGSKTC